ncbi:uncharacterized protein 5-like [Dreissena polymorpha]|uniref:Farnesoic acid O-methyl transferase domain-containing protein n=1 Tax=Dreissena polymorpha TaxID=45954 RepID=A0A9D4LVH4_DREPO|nr:uncharacterized protein 5-like [Dreissena polymorpha]KAH3864522.1 hypothetical protein DPMN_027541 [Dreissena polymorpha]
MFFDSSKGNCVGCISVYKKASDIRLIAMQGTIYFSSSGKLTYNCPVQADYWVDYSRFNPYNDGLRADTINSLTFQTMGNHGAHILLQSNNIDFNNSEVEIVIGGWFNNRSVIRGQQQGPTLSNYTGSVLSGSSFRWFWISWNGGCVKVGKDSAVGDSKILEWCGLSFPINGIRFGYCCGSGGTFIIPIRHSH